MQHSINLFGQYWGGVGYFVLAGGVCGINIQPEYIYLFGQPIPFSSISKPPHAAVLAPPYLRGPELHTPLRRPLSLCRVTQSTIGLEGIYPVFSGEAST